MFSEVAANTHHHRRMIESELATFGLSRTLQESVPAPSEADIGLQLRLEVEEDARYGALSDSLRRSLFRAVSKAPDQPTKNLLVGLGKNAQFVALDAELQRALIQVFDTPAVKSALVVDTVRLLNTTSFAPLSRSVQRVLIEELGRLCEDSAARKNLQTIIECPGFTTLRSVEQSQLLRYHGGPDLALEIAPMRKNRLQLSWNIRRADLMQIIKSPRFPKMTAAAQAATLRNFLHGGNREIFFLDATKLNGHAAIIFGNPADPRSHSYGRRWVLHSGSKPAAKIYSPDPTARAGWKEPKRVSPARYAFRAVRVSRFTEWKLLCHIEQVYVIADDLRVRASGLGAHRISVKQSGCIDEVFSVLMSFLAPIGAVEIREGYMEAGRELGDEKKSPRVSDELLAKFLRA